MFLSRKIIRKICLYQLCRKGYDSHVSINYVVKVMINLSRFTLPFITTTTPTNIYVQKMI